MMVTYVRETVRIPLVKRNPDPKKKFVSFSISLQWLCFST